MLISRLGPCRGRILRPAGCSLECGSLQVVTATRHVRSSTNRFIKVSSYSSSLPPPPLRTPSALASQAKPWKMGRRPRPRPPARPPVRPPARPPARPPVRPPARPRDLQHPPPHVVMQRLRRRSRQQRRRRQGWPRTCASGRACQHLRYQGQQYSPFVKFGNFDSMNSNQPGHNISLHGRTLALVIKPCPRTFSSIHLRRRLSHEYLQ